MPEGDTVPWGRVCYGQTAYFAGGKEKVGLISILSWEILERGEKWYCVIVYVFTSL